MLYVERERDRNCCSVCTLPHPFSTMFVCCPILSLQQCIWKVCIDFSLELLTNAFLFWYIKNKKSRLFILFIFFLWLSGVLSPLLKSRWAYCFCFFPSVFFCLFSHSIPTRNGAIWWVYYCGIVLCFGLGLLSPWVKLKTHTHRWWLCWAIQWIRIRIPLPLTIKGFLDIIL